MKFLIQNIRWLWLPILILAFVVVSIVVKSWIPITALVLFFAFILFMSSILTALLKGADHKVFIIHNHADKSDEELVKDVMKNQESDDTVMH